MRALVNYKKNFGVTEITDIGYSDKLVDAFSGNKTEKKGLFFIDLSDTETWFIEGLSEEICAEICEEALAKGFVDLRKYGSATHM